MNNIRSIRINVVFYSRNAFSEKKKKRKKNILGKIGK